MGKSGEKLKNFIRRKMDQMPLWAEFTLFLALIMILFTAVLSWFIYNREQNRIIDAQLKANHSLLDLRMSNMESYIDTLSAFSIMPVYSSDIYAMLVTSDALSDAAIENIRSNVRTYLYSRGTALRY